jgi:AbiV family abortive infection protein
MQPRALKRLMQLPREKRQSAIAEGLGLLAVQVEALDGGLKALAEAESWRGLEILSAQADEEAAKALILLDYLRMDQRNEEALARQLGRFYNHLARCIYVEMAHMNPADFAEVRMLVDTMRPSQYLDGPNDVDWIFRNQLLAQREESLYVDYIHQEEGDRWITPAANDVFMYPRPMAPVRRLVGALHHLGGTSEAGLSIIAEHWAPVTLEERTQWQEAAAINRAVVEELIGQGIGSPESTPEDAGFAIEHWPFRWANWTSA